MNTVFLIDLYIGLINPHCNLKLFSNDSVQVIIYILLIMANLLIPAVVSFVRTGSMPSLIKSSIFGFGFLDEMPRAR